MTFPPIFPGYSWDCILLVDLEMLPAILKTTGNREAFCGDADATLSVAQQCKPSVSSKVVIIFSCQTSHYENIWQSSSMSVTYRSAVTDIRMSSMKDGFPF